MRNRNGCQTPSQSGLNPKCEVDNSRESERTASQRISKELHTHSSSSNVLFVLGSGIPLIPIP